MSESAMEWMRWDCTYSSVCHEKGVCESSSEPGKTVLGESSLAENTADKELCGRVSTTLGRAKLGGHEWQRLGTPNVTVVDNQHRDVADEETHNLVDLENQRQRCLERCDLKRTRRISNHQQKHTERIVDSRIASPKRWRRDQDLRCWLHHRKGLSEL